MMKREKRTLLAERLRQKKESARKSALTRKLREAFLRIAEVRPEPGDKRQHDFVFHMLDWEEDLVQLAKFYSEPASFSPRDIRRLLRGFLHHVPNHLIQAARLGGFLTDLFAGDLSAPDRSLSRVHQPESGRGPNPLGARRQVRRKRAKERSS